MIEEIVDEPQAPPPPPPQLSVDGVPDPDELYRERTEGRIKKEWEDQLGRARQANEDIDQEDVDAHELYGSQSQHNYPDVHADWGDDAGVRAAAARAARASGVFPNHLSSGWNSEYRQQLEDAMVCPHPAPLT